MIFKVREQPHLATFTQAINELLKIAQLHSENEAYVAIDFLASNTHAQKEISNQEYKN